VVGTIVAGAAGVVAAPTVAGLAWRRARQRQVKALQIDTENATVEPSVRQVGRIDNGYLLFPRSGPPEESGARRFRWSNRCGGRDRV
jgi:hypothetical protein